MALSNTNDVRRLIVFIAAFALIGCAFLVIFRDVPHHHPEGYDQLMSAINNHDPKAVESILRSGVNPNKFPQNEIDLMEEDDIAPLNSAAWGGNTEIVKLLLDHGADPNLGDGWSYNPLSAASEHESLEAMKLLIRRGAKVNDESGNSYALWRAAMDGKVRAVNFLLDHGANPNSNLSGPLVQALKDTNSSPEVIEIIRRKVDHSKSLPIVVIPDKY